LADGDGAVIGGLAVASDADLRVLERSVDHARGQDPRSPEAGIVSHWRLTYEPAGC
jgi:hypothetical protein